MFTYSFPYDGAETTFEKSFPFGADSLRVLSPNEVLTLASEDIGAPEPVTIGERPYQLIETSDIERGKRINVQLSGLPQTTLADRVQGAVAGARYEYIAPALLARRIPDGAHPLRHHPPQDKDAARLTSIWRSGYEQKHPERHRHSPSSA